MDKYSMRYAHIGLESLRSAPSIFPLQLFDLRECPAEIIIGVHGRRLKFIQGGKNVAIIITASQKILLASYTTVSYVFGSVANLTGRNIFDSAFVCNGSSFFPDFHLSA